MKLREFCDPLYLPQAGPMIRVLQKLMVIAHGHTEPQGGPRYVYGPYETLVGYHSCTGCRDQPWHSGRFVQEMGNPTPNPMPLKGLMDKVQRCIGHVLLQRYNGFPDLDWETRIKRHSGDGDAAEKAWDRVCALKHRRLATWWNPCHKNARCIMATELVISKTRVAIRWSIGCKNDPWSSWDADHWYNTRWNASINRIKPRLMPYGPKDFEWHVRKESFAQFLDRVAKQIGGLCLDA